MNNNRRKEYFKVLDKLEANIYELREGWRQECCITKDELQRLNFMEEEVEELRWLVDKEPPEPGEQGELR